MSYKFVASSRYQKQAQTDMPVMAVWEGFSENTTAHGIPHVKNARGPIKVTFWTLVSLVCFGVLIYNTYIQVDKYLSFDVKVIVDLKYKKEMTYPAVTVCNHNPIRQSELHMNDYLRSILSSDSETADEGADTEQSQQGSAVTASPPADDSGGLQPLLSRKKRAPPGGPSPAPPSSATNGTAANATTTAASLGGTPGGGDFTTAEPYTGTAPSNTAAATPVVTVTSPTPTSAPSGTPAPSGSPGPGPGPGSAPSGSPDPSPAPSGDSNSTDTAGSGASGVTSAPVAGAPPADSGSGPSASSSDSGSALIPSPSDSGSALIPSPSDSGSALSPSPGDSGSALSPSPDDSESALSPSPDDSESALSPSPDDSVSAISLSLDDAVSALGLSLSLSNLTGFEQDEFDADGGMIDAEGDTGGDSGYGYGGQQGPQGGDRFSPDGRQQRASFETQKKVQKALADMSDDLKAPLGYQLEDLIIDCEYGGYECIKDNDFTTFYNTMYGNCYTFNSGWNTSQTRQKSYRPGPQYGLALTFNIDQDNYIGDLAESAGIRIVVHPQDNMPFPEDEGVSIGPGLLTYVAISLVEISRLGGKYGDCVDATLSNTTSNVFEERYPVNYSSSACYKTCYQRYVIERCGCGDSQYPFYGNAFDYLNVSACDISDDVQVECVDNVTADYQADELPCDCLLSCVEATYSPTLSSVIWPSEKYRETLFESLASSNEKIRNVLNNHNDPNKYQKNLAKAIIYFKEFNYESINENPNYEAGSFMSDLGGILGLYLGFSVMTIMEFMEVGFDMLALLIIKVFVRRGGRVTSSRECLSPKTGFDMPTKQPLPAPTTNQSPPADTLHPEKSDLQKMKKKQQIQQKGRDPDAPPDYFFRELSTSPIPGAIDN